MKEKLSAFFIFILLISGTIWSNDLEKSSKALKRFSIAESMDKNNSIDLILYSEYFTDKSGKLSIKEIHKMDQRGKFKQIQHTPLELGFTTDAAWLKFKIEDKVSNAKQRWFLEFLNPVISYIDVYFVDGQDRLSHIYSGGHKRALENRTFHVNCFVDITDHINKGGTFYVRVQSIFSLVIGMRLLQDDQYYLYDSKNRILPGIVVGILLALFLFNFFVFLSIRDITYLYFSLYILFGLPQLMINFGLLKIFFHEYVALEIFFLNLTLSIWVGFHLLFMRKFLNFQILQPTVNHLILYYIGFWFIFGLLNYWIPPSLYYNLMAILGFSGLAIGIYGSIKSIIIGYNPARYFLSGYIIFALLFGLYLLIMVKVIPFNNFSLFLLIPGLAFAGEGIMFTFALANRYKRLADESKAYSQIQKDMLFAMETQKHLFPPKISNHKSYHLVGSYFPSSQVSGDFFDIIESVDRKTITILIADVAGHSYSAAIISAMVKVAFHECFDIRFSLSRQLEKMNHILLKMIKDTFVTAGILQINYEKMKATYAQAGHMPLLISNKQGNKIKQIKPPGKPLGIFSQNGLWIETKFNLEKNDRIVLYTDGLTELWNSTNIMFGEERLLEFIQLNHIYSADEFTRRLTDELKNWDSTQLTSQEDDITFVVYDLH